MCAGVAQAGLFVSSNGYPIVRCNDCRLVFTDDRNAPPASELYPAFDQSDGWSQRSARSALGAFLLQRAGVVKAVKSSGRLLDYGCGNGAFARHMSTAGFEAVGLEPYSLGKPFEAAGLRLVQGPLSQVGASLGKFDVITLWHVLEHVRNPVELLTALNGHLHPGGALVISVPNFASWQSKVFGGSWFHLDPPRHLLHFEAATLTDCLARAGLSPVAETPFLPEYGSSGWIQSALNQFLPHKNYLYEFVKDRGALKRMSAASSAMHFAASAISGAPILGASVPVEALAAQFNKAAALTVAAKALP